MASLGVSSWAELVICHCDAVFTRISILQEEGQTPFIGQCLNGDTLQYIRVSLTVAGVAAGLVTRQARNTLVRARRVLTLLIGTRLGIQTLIYVWNN